LRIGGDRDLKKKVLMSFEGSERTFSASKTSQHSLLLRGIKFLFEKKIIGKLFHEQREGL